MDTNRHLRGYEALVNWFIGKTLAATALVLALFFASSTVKVQAATPPGLAYPLWDWRLVKDGALPQTVGYFPLEDVLSIKVEDGARLNVTPNQMVVVLQSQVAWKKEIAAWGSCQGTTSFVFTDGSNVGPNSMLITKGTCGTDTIVLRKAKAWGWMTDMYNLDLTNFWRLWAGKIVTKLSAKSELAEPFRYTIRRREALSRFLADARIEIDNNIAENAMRGIALGRKNYLFAGSDTGSDRAAAMHTIMQTAKLNDLNPEAYLRDTLAKIAEGHSISRSEELMPWTFAGMCS